MIFFPIFCTGEKFFAPTAHRIGIHASPVIRIIRPPWPRPGV
jgi:hypothetical protein